jgi:hypothetical protein
MPHILVFPHNLPISTFNIQYIRTLQIFMFAPCINSIKALFITPTDAHNYKIIEMLKTIKIPTIAPTCFGSTRNHHQGAISCLAKTTIMILLCSSLVMWSILWWHTRNLPLPCTARLHNRLVCRHDIDHVINDEHNRIIIVVLAKHEIAP